MSATLAPPKGWKYLLWAFFLLLMLIPVWTVIVMMVIEPSSLATEHASTLSRVAWWVGIPLLLVSMVLGGHWVKASLRASAANESRNHNLVATAPGAEQSHQREYVLEIIGMGATLDKYRQEALWDAIAKSNPYVTLREMDPKKYPWASDDKDGLAGGRVNDTLENAATLLPKYWGIPSFYAGSPILDANGQPRENAFEGGIIGDPESTGLSWHLFTAGPWRLAERPDHLLDEVFKFFDQNPDVPFIVVSAADDPWERELDMPSGTPGRFKNEYAVPAMPDSSAMFVLARRERVDPIRPYVFEDPDNQFVNKLRDLYWDSHAPTIAQWLKITSQFAHSDAVKPRGFSALAKELSPINHAPPSDFKPTPWWPLPWNTEQLDAFDRLPTLGYLHRPTWVKLTDDEGKPLAKTARIQALGAGLQAAMTTIPQDKRPKLPQRFVFGTGDNTDQLLALHQAISGIDPDFDMSKPTYFIDTDKKLGNTGAATLFMQMAIGTMGSYREGGISAAVNLRDPNEASIVLITPPSEEKRKSQQGVFGSHITPDFDPKNYQ